MKSKMKFLLLCSTLLLSSAACTASTADEEGNELGSETLLRLDLEVVGSGDIAISEPYLESCSAGSTCSFFFYEGTTIRFESGGQFAIESDTAVVASQGGISKRGRDLGFLPEQPWIIVDPVRSDPFALQPERTADIAIEEVQAR